MEVTIAHDLGREEVRRRLKTSSHSIGKTIPGGMAEVHTSWPEEDRMDMTIRLMGQSMAGDVQIADDNVRFRITLPPSLGFIEPMVQAAIRDQGQRLLA